MLRLIKGRFRVGIRYLDLLSVLIVGGLWCLVWGILSGLARST